jgi:O-antigen ligase
MNRLILNYRLDLIIYTLFLSLPFLFVLSRFFLEFVLILLSIIFLIKVMKNKDFSYFNNFFFKFFLVFYFYLLINHLTKSETLLPSVIFYFRYGIYVLSIFYFLSNYKNIYFYFLKMTLFIILFIALDSIFQYLFKYNIIGLKIIEPHRVSSFFGDELILGGFTLRGILPFLILLLISKYKQIKTNLIYLGIILCYLTIFLSGERIAISSSILLAFFYIFFLNQNNEIKFFKKIFIVIVILFLFFGFFLKSYQHRYFVQILHDLNSKSAVTAEMIATKKDLKDSYIFLSGLHHNMMLTGFSIFKDNIFFGSGPHSYRTVCADDKYSINVFSCQSHPHNFTIQILSETGIVGFLFYITFLIILIREMFRLKLKRDKKSFLKLSILAFYLVTFLPMAPSGNFFNNWLSIMIYFPVGFYLYLNNKKEF